MFKSAAAESCRGGRAGGIPVGRTEATIVLGGICIKDYIWI